MYLQSDTTVYEITKLLVHNAALRFREVIPSIVLQGLKPFVQRSALPQPQRQPAARCDRPSARNSKPVRCQHLHVIFASCIPLVSWLAYKCARSRSCIEYSHPRNCGLTTALTSKIRKHCIAAIDGHSEREVLRWKSRRR